MRADLRADAVLERRDDLAARRVVLGIGGERHHHVQPQAHGIAFDLNVALLQDVEQPDLDLAREIRQLVDGEDAAIRTRQQAVVHREIVAELQAAPRGLDGVDVSEHVGDRDVGRGELLDVAVVAPEPRDRQVGALGGGARPAGGAQRRQRIVVDLAPRHDGDDLVEQPRQAAQQAGLRLAAEAEQDEVVFREEGVHQLRNDGLVVADDAGKERLAALELRDQIGAEFVLDRRVSWQTRVDGGAQRARRARLLTGDHVRF